MLQEVEEEGSDLVSFSNALRWMLHAHVKIVHLFAALGLVSMMLHYVISRLEGLHKTGCSGETRLVLHKTSSP